VHTAATGTVIKDAITSVVTFFGPADPVVDHAQVDRANYSNNEEMLFTLHYFNHLVRSVTQLALYCLAFIYS
jgi:hypothetical protein